MSCVIIFKLCNYSGWADLVSQKLCCLLDGRCADSTVTNTDTGSEGGLTVSDTAIRNLPIITQLRNRIISVERKGASVYTPPKILARFVTNRVGQRVDICRAPELCRYHPLKF